MMANTLAQWERAHRDLGIEMALFSNLIALTVDAFDEYRNKSFYSQKYNDAYWSDFSRR